jgi:glutamate synthase domain-containing protein 1
VAAHPHGQSDTASLDNALELLIAGGYGIAHAMMMLIPKPGPATPDGPSAARSTNITPR